MAHPRKISTGKSFRYLVIGAGRQGAAAAYDLARFGDAEQIHLVDQDAAIARNVSRRIDSLAGKRICTSGKLEVGRTASAVRGMKGFDAVLSAVPYFLNESLSKAAVRAKASFCDLGGNLNVVRRQLKQHAAARKAGIAIVPDCGLAPGMANIFAVYVVDEFKARGLGKPLGVRLYCGGLPQVPRPPLGYQLFFSLEGLLNEYEGQSLILRKGRIQKVDTLSEVESVTFRQPVGRCEAFVTSGGTSLGPWHLRKKVAHYDYKTVRFPGHVDKIRTMRDLGMWSRKEILVGGTFVSPREAFKAVVGPCLTTTKPEDRVVLRVLCYGAKHRESGRSHEISLNLVDEYDPRSGFSAMERTTGFSAAVVMIMMAKGQIEAGAQTADGAVPAGAFLRAIRQRGIQVTVRSRSL